MDTKSYGHRKNGWSLKFKMVLKNTTLPRYIIQMLL